MMRPTHRTGGPIRGLLAVALGAATVIFASGCSGDAATDQAQVEVTPPGAQTLPLPPIRRTGLTATPAFEGWYDNPDGSITLSFGYMNRNFEEDVVVPLGPDNFIEPALYDGVQPTHLATRRHWGVFGVNVPADFDGRVSWTLTTLGQKSSIPANLGTDYKIDALEGEAGSGNTPPVLTLEGAPEARGPGGSTAGPLMATVGEPLAVALTADDDGRGGRRGRGGQPPVIVTITWFPHQGPGEVTFSPETSQIREGDGGEVRTMVTFSEPGDYIIRARANDASGVTGAGHAQCCWTNAFIKVSVTR